MNCSSLSPIARGAAPEIYSIEISSSEFEREAINTKNLNEEERQKVEKLINMIDEDEDVQNVYHDMKIID